MGYFLAEFHKGKTGPEGIIEVTLKPSGNYAAPEEMTLDQFCKKHKARVIGVTPGLAGAAATVLICFETDDAHDKPGETPASAAGFPKQRF